MSDDLTAALTAIYAAKQACVASIEALNAATALLVPVPEPVEDEGPVDLHHGHEFHDIQTMGALVRLCSCGEQWNVVPDDLSS